MHVKEREMIIFKQLQIHLACRLGMYVTGYNVWIQLVTSHSTQHRRTQGVPQPVMGAGAGEGRGVLEIFVITLNSLPGPPITPSHLRGVNKQMFEW